jgi:hypothetical protein
MSDAQAVSLLRVTDDAGSQFVAACVPAGSASLVAVGEDESWTESCRPVTSVLLDVNGIVQLTDSRDISAVSAWLAAAAVWLREMQLDEEAEEEAEGE